MPNQQTNTLEATGTSVDIEVLVQGLVDKASQYPDLPVGRLLRDFTDMIPVMNRQFKADPNWNFKRALGQALSGNIGARSGP